MDLRTDPGFLGTNAPLIADLTLLAYLLLIVPAMVIGFFFARRKWFEPHHKFTMTGITLLNWFLIAFVMAVSYSDSVAPQIPENLNENAFFFPTIHLFTGAVAQTLATYLVIRMWFENQLPAWFKVKNIKRYMRTTLTFWLLTAAIGVTIYFTWYVETGEDSGSPEPVATEEAIVPGSTEEASSGEITPEPATTEEVSETEEPTEEPAATEEVAETEEPTEEPEPAATEDVGATEEPEPTATEEPAATEEDEPEPTEEPTEEPEPAATEEVAETEELAVTEEVSETEEPAATEEVDEPATTEEP